MLSVGDRVVVADGSYAKSVIGGKLIHEFLSFGDAKGRPYTVIAKGCTSLSELESHQPDEYFNDTIIQDDNGKVVFIHHRFLAPAKHKIVIYGKTIEISHESYVELKRTLC